MHLSHIPAFNGKLGGKRTNTIAAYQQSLKYMQAALKLSQTLD